MKLTSRYEEVDTHADYVGNGVYNVVTNSYTRLGYNKDGSINFVDFDGGPLVQIGSMFDDHELVSIEEDDTYFKFYTKMTQEEIEEEKRKNLSAYTPSIPFKGVGKQPDMVNEPPHYNKKGDIETFDKIRRVRGDEAAKAFCLGNSDKYRDRAGYKIYDGLTLEESIVRDIKKAMWYENKINELDGNV